MSHVGLVAYNAHVEGWSNPMGKPGLVYRVSRDGLYGKEGPSKDTIVSFRTGKNLSSSPNNVSSLYTTREADSALDYSYRMVQTDHR